MCLKKLLPQEPKHFHCRKGELLRSKGKYQKHQLFKSIKNGLVLGVYVPNVWNASLGAINSASMQADTFTFICI